MTSITTVKASFQMKAFQLDSSPLLFLKVVLLHIILKFCYLFLDLGVLISKTRQHQNTCRYRLNTFFSSKAPIPCVAVFKDEASKKVTGL